MLFQCEGKGIVGFLCILIRTDGITIVLIHIVANQCNFLYDAEVACFDGVTAIGVSIHIVEDGGNPLWLLCIIGGEKLTGRFVLNPDGENQSAYAGVPWRAGDFAPKGKEYLPRYP